MWGSFPVFCRKHNILTLVSLFFFLPHLPGMFRNVTSISSQPLPFKSFPIYNLSIIHAADRWYCSCIWVYVYNRNCKSYISLCTPTCFGNQIAIFAKYIEEYKFMYDLEFLVMCMCLCTWMTADAMHKNEQYYNVTVECRDRHWRLSLMNVKLLRCYARRVKPFLFERIIFGSERGTTVLILCFRAS